MPKLRKTAKFYKLDYIGQNLSFLLIKEGDFLYIDNAEIFYRVADDHIKLADFLYRLHNKGVNWLMLEYDIPEIRQLYIEFQICQFTEDNEPCSGIGTPNRGR
jgi:hypothetical protein